MTDIAVTAAQVGMIDPTKASVKSYQAGSTVTKGQLVAMDTDGSVDPADANSGGGYLFEQVVGVALNGGGAGQAIDVISGGEVYGFTVSGKDSGDLIYASNTAGAVADAAGDVTVIIGRVSPLTDKAITEVIRLDILFAVAKAS